MKTQEVINVILENYDLGDAGSFLFAHDLLPKGDVTKEQVEQALINRGIVPSRIERILRTVDEVLRTH